MSGRTRCNAAGPRRVDPASCPRRPEAALVSPRALTASSETAFLGAWWLGGSVLSPSWSPKARGGVLLLLKDEV